MKTNFMNLLDTPPELTPKSRGIRAVIKQN